MKILVYSESYLPSTCTFIYNEIEELAKYNEVKIICGEHLNETNIPNTKVEKIVYEENKLKRSISYRLENLGFSFANKNSNFSKQLQQIIHEFNPDVIHSHFGTDSQKIANNLQDTNIPLFISFHGYDASQALSDKSYRNNLKQIFNRPNVFPIFVSNFMKKQVESRIGQSIKNYNILYYGTNTEIFKRTTYDSPKPPVTFLQVSSFRGKKGHQYTLQAFKKFITENPTTEAKLILAGSGPTFDQIKNLAQDLDLQNHVEFPGFMSITEAKALMEKAHVFVHHSVTPEDSEDMEGIPNAIMESMAMELPVLSTIHSGIPELVEDGVHGFLVAERDVDTYADRMKQISTWSYKKENRQKIETLFEKKTHRTMLESFYKNAMAIL